jgi:hypothetical protein
MCQNQELSLAYMETRSVLPCPLHSCLSSVLRNRQSFIQGFFSNHNEFVYDEKEDSFEQFHALADYMRWDPRHTETAHAHLQDALVLQFNAMYGADEKSLAHWQFICQILHVFLVPVDIAACKDVRLSSPSENCNCELTTTLRRYAG